MRSNPLNDRAVLCVVALSVVSTTCFEVKLIRSSIGEQNLEERPSGIKRRQSEKGSYTSTDTHNGTS